MIEQAITKVEQLARASAKTTVLQVEGERDGTYYLIGPDGKAELKTAAPAWHEEKLATPEQLAAFVKDHSGGEGVVFYSDAGIHYVYNSEDRRDGAFCSLPKSPQWTTLANVSGKLYKQTDFVRLLRIDLRGCLADGNLLSLVRQLKFSNDQAAAGQIEQGRMSISKSTVAQVMGAESFPEETAVDFPVFENYAPTQRVGVALEIFPIEQQFRLTPYPMEMQRALKATLAEISKLFVGKDMPLVYFGSAD